MIRIATLLLAFCLWPLAAHSLGLGRLELESGLNEPVEGRIELIAATRTDLDSLIVRLADIEAFKRAGIDRPFVLSSLRFEVVESEDGPDYIRVFSRESIREPILNFLVEANWSSGRLYREYTALLDPPLYDLGARGLVPAPAAPPTLPAAETEMETAGAGMPAVAEPAPVISGAYSGGDYGPTVSSDTLWSVASLTRPDSSVTVQQMMLALLRENPEAFIDGNVNGLRRGHILRMPGRDDISALSRDQALAEVRSQYAAWEQARGALAAATPERPVSGAKTSAATGAVPARVAAAAVEDKSELRLVAPTDQGTGADQAAATVSPPGDRQARENLALANEQLEALSQENLELKDRLSEAETIIEDLKRLIALKDDELAALQKQLAGAAAAESAAALAPVEAPAEAAADQAPVAEDTGEPTEAAIEEAPATTETVEEAAPPEQKPAAPPRQPTAAPSGGILAQIVAFIAGNVLVVGGAAGALVLVLLVLVVIAGRRRAEAVAAEEAAVEFPDFSGSEEDTEMPVASEDVTDIKVDAAAAAPSAPKLTVVPAAPAAAKPAAAKPPPAPPQPAPAPAAAEEDPLAEVNVFLAYEHFDQAEDFVRDAIKREPKNLEFHSKLLEVFYAANDRKKFEAEAKVLHGLVSGAGPYWETALAYWQEMSPNRALFAAPAAEEEEEAPAAAAAGAGVLDLTADEGAEADTGGGLDFDLGETAQPAARDDEALDLTAALGEGEPLAQASAPSGDESILDVTAAVGLDADLESFAEPSGGSSEDVLDLTGGSSAAGDRDVLDISQSGGEDLLDVTAHADLDAGQFEEDLLDVTAAAKASAAEQDALEVPEEPGPGTDDKSLDFDLSLDTADASGEQPAEEESVASAGNVIDFEPSVSAGAVDEEPLSLELDSGDAAGLELDLSSELGEEAAAESPESLDSGLSLDSGGADDLGLELDLEEPARDEPGGTDSEEPGLEPDMGESALDKAAEFELDLGMDEEASAPPAGGAAGGLDIDMDGTVEIPTLELVDEDAEGDAGDHTVFVPRAADTEEQSAEDEIVTKLDLAKAYVELGDKDSARSILDEVLAAGNEQQRRQAQDLMNQLS